ncbi:hypothetical protein Bpfe_007852 [Biomphalaria pfeifferi]|uniref:Uncharacterized protein n=1 Tax=Biomphalaria pfeifferi TaxID=112525 RepID=A0AAD8BYY0_BIOPF|nr:hypothetical protein Bpfe_007852 [Biomphalaria pfeifferi]
MSYIKFRCYASNSDATLQIQMPRFKLRCQTTGSDAIPQVNSSFKFKFHAMGSMIANRRIYSILSGERSLRNPVLVPRIIQCTLQIARRKGLREQRWTDRSADFFYPRDVQSVQISRSISNTFYPYDFFALGFNITKLY